MHGILHVARRPTRLPTDVFFDTRRTLPDWNSNDLNDYAAKKDVYFVKTELDIYFFITVHATVRPTVS